MSAAENTPEKITMSIDDMADSLTGFEEIAISEAFGAELFDLSSMRMVRALVFVHHLRQGLKHADAKRTTLGLTVKQVGEMFPDDEEEPMPEEPITESGKDDSRPENEPTNSPPSAS